MGKDTLFYGKDWVEKCRVFYDEKWVAQNLGSYLIANKNEWAYCPKCRLEWNTKPISWFGLFLNQPARHLVKTKVEDQEKRPDKLCPFHGECFVTGKRMGTARHVRKRALDKMNKAGRILCPNCKGLQLRMIGQNDKCWTCDSCNCFIVLEKGYLNGINGETGVVQMSYREDLRTKETNEFNKLFAKLVKILNSPAVMIDKMK